MSEAKGLAGTASTSSANLTTGTAATPTAPSQRAAGPDAGAAPGRAPALAGASEGPVPAGRQDPAAAIHDAPAKSEPATGAVPAVPSREPQQAGPRNGGADVFRGKGLTDAKDAAGAAHASNAPSGTAQAAAAPHDDGAEAGPASGSAKAGSAANERPVSAPRQDAAPVSRETSTSPGPRAEALPSSATRATPQSDDHGTSARATPGQGSQGQAMSETKGSVQSPAQNPAQSPAHGQTMSSGPASAKAPDAQPAAASAPAEKSAAATPVEKPVAPAPVEKQAAAPAPAEAGQPQKDAPASARQAPAMPVKNEATMPAAATSGETTVAATTDVKAVPQQDDRAAAFARTGLLTPSAAPVARFADAMPASAQVQPSATNQIANALASALTDMSPAVGANGADRTRLRAGGAALKTIQIQLAPEQLGKVNVTLKLIEGNLSVHIEAMEPDTAMRLKDDAEGLKALLKSVGFDVDDAVITLGSRDGQRMAQASGMPGDASASGQARGEGSAGGQSSQHGQSGQRDQSGGRPARPEPVLRPNEGAGESGLRHMGLDPSIYL